MLGGRVIIPKAHFLRRRDMIVTTVTKSLAATGETVGRRQRLRMLEIWWVLEAGTQCPYTAADTNEFDSLGFMTPVN